LTITSIRISFDAMFESNLLFSLSWLLLSSFLFGFLLYYYLFTLKSSKKECWHLRDENFKPKVSIIIPTYNEEKTILRKLRNTVSLEYPRERLEIILVDSASTDNTAKKIENFVSSADGKEYNIKFIHEEKRVGKSHALNRALAHCTGDLVAITDADSILERNSLKNAVKNFADPRVGAVTGRILVKNAESSDITKREKVYREIYDIFRLGESKHYSTFIFNGPLAVFRRVALERFYPGADDSGTAMEIILKGYRAIYEPDAIVYENASRGLKGMFLQKMRRGVNIIDVIFFTNSKLKSISADSELLKIHRLNFILHVVVPFLFLIWLGLSFILLIFNQTFFVLLIIGLALYLFPGTRKIVHAFASFMSSQIILIQSMIKFAKGERYVTWSIIEDVREEVEDM
ncbi:MAG: glycosyltransferase, partial [Thermoplasmata archaeon]